MEDTRHPQDVQVKKGHPWSAQVGIAIAALMEGGAGGLIGWVTDVSARTKKISQYLPRS